MMHDDGLEDIRAKSSAAQEKFKQVLSRVKTDLHRKFCILEVANGNSICPSPPSTIILKHVGGIAAYETARKVSPDLIIVDGDDMEAVGSLDELADIDAVKIMVVSRDSDILGQVKNLVNQIIFKPVGTKELIQIANSLAG